eukprot:Plantae.Rhodophyta-Palmaria_palmata.ctg14716.p1 GENE.Plantae.Rhodophyta-Palmaria_palmata.ctg14716~~Plantae.Rhodophyta-Palmaria_palmata.ctg14716.p1  ORF type:complete len:201 (-),score=15.59 Plantae.Rhodophyta-Palmaria_palmata.ctg14716:638-1240(-)
MHLATRGVSQAYVSTVHTLLRTVFIIPLKEASIHPDELWKLRRPLYGLPEAGAMWYSTFARYHRNSLMMHHTATGPAVFVRHASEGRLEGLSVLQVDDTLVIGNETFMASEAKESDAFPFKGRTLIQSKPVGFNGTNLSRRDCDVVVEQHDYTDALSANFLRTPEGFATARGKNSYATASTRPDHGLRYQPGSPSAGKSV